MIQKKVCLLGSFAVGKTSLVSRFVRGLFSQKYLTTVGVKVDKKNVTVDGTDVVLVVWDLAGEDELMGVKASYLRGMSGYILVADGTRAESLETAIKLRRRVEEEVGSVPYVFVINKSDLSEQWELDSGECRQRLGEASEILHTSAKTGDGVEEAFASLARKAIGAGA